MHRRICLSLAALLTVSSSVTADVSLGELEQDAKIGAFTADAVYVTETGTPMGARFRHESGFVLDLLRIQSVPQAFTWVNTAPVSDRGEPHTLEHLLLGKGTKGRYVASLEDMSLGSSSAFTMQLRTCYHFQTGSGIDVFFNLFEEKLDAMLHPNFSDEEIRREVMNMGIAADPVDGTLRLEEKGTVYNEMVSSYERIWANLYLETGRLLYGKGHPLSWESGGTPEGIRTMVPQDIRDFHAATHHLNNMGSVVALPDDVSLEDALERFGDIFERLEPGARPGAHPDDYYDNLRAAAPAPMGTMMTTVYPHQNENEPGEINLTWPPVLDIDPREEYLLDLFITNLGSGQTSNLYKKFVDSQTRELDLGATAVYAWHQDDPGHPIFINIETVDPEFGTQDGMGKIREAILEEIEKIANFPDGSDELAAFNERALNRIVERRRGLRDFLNSPPRFGYRRGGGSGWMNHLKHLHRAGGFTRQLALTDEIEHARRIIDNAEKKNIWRDYIAQWKLLENQPYAVMTLASPEYMARLEAEGEQRIRKYEAKLETEYGVDSEEAALRVYKADYDEKSAEIDAEAATIELPDFTESPPMTLDDQLDYEVEKLPGGGDLLFSRFDNITGATIGLAFNLNVVPERDFVYLSALPTFMREVGVVRDGEAIPYDEMQELLRREVLRLETDFDVDTGTERVELVVRGAGSDLPETQNALRWMRSVLFEPDLRAVNLPRIRDAVDLALRNMRDRMKRAEETWVQEPAAAYRMQENPLILATDNFLTRAHAYHRLRWLLRTGDEPVQNQFGEFVEMIEQLPAGRSRQDLSAILAAVGQEGADSGADGKVEELRAALGGLSDDAAALAKDALEDLRLTIAEVPDESLAADWSYLCNQMRHDLAIPPEQTLDAVRSLVALIGRRDNVRGFVTASRATWDDARADLEDAINALGSERSQAANVARRPVVIQRVNQRNGGSIAPKYVGLVNESTRSGVHINSSDCARYTDVDEAHLLKLLTTRLYGGGGAHSLFMKTWGAGLAYSNGVGANVETGRLSYYAERCPDLAQTMQFVVDVIKNAPHDPTLADYAVAQTFQTNRAGDRYESRCEEMAADLADGQTPETVARFRRAILELREDDSLYDRLHDLMPETYGEVMPGLGPTGDRCPNAIYFVIGPESQLTGYEAYLKSVEGAGVTLYRIYPRDFWLVSPMAQ